MEHALRYTPRHKLSSFGPDELASMQSAIHAVCEELGITEAQEARRSGVAERILDSYQRGHKLPLDLVSRGLAEPQVTGIR